MIARQMRLILLVLAILFFAVPALPALASSPRAMQEARVVAVNDGDTVTLRIEGKRVRTRLIGYDAPEMGQEPWGERARGHLRALLKGSGWEVRVETDAEKYDKYDRLLVYLWTRDKALVNERMLQDGYGVLFTFPLNTRYVDRFRKAQREAREKRFGIWGPRGLRERPSTYKRKHPRQ